MKCTECNGTGRSIYGYNQSCFLCNGSGIIEPMTNDEWLRSASAEELAGAIYEWHSLGYTRGKNGKKLNSITEVVEWLKEIHHE